MTTRHDRDLSRFVTAQEGVYHDVIDELSSGRKRSHWMWFIFPQIAGLGFSPMAQRYAIRSREEARAYLSHDLLSARLEQCTRLVLAVSDASITDIMGHPDDVKFISSMTLFHAVSQSLIFGDAIDRFAQGRGDALTLEILESGQ